MEGINVRGYQINVDDEAQEMERLRSQGYAISAPVTVEGMHVGFLAVMTDPWSVVTEAILVSSVAP